MDFQTYRKAYGEKLHAFLESDAGRELIEALKENGPIVRLSKLPPEVQVANAALFLGQITGFHDVVPVLDLLRLPPEEKPRIS